MIEILKTILISGFSSSLVFWFGQKAIKTKERNDDKKKLNKLLFHLILLKKELNKLNGFYEMMNAIINKMKLYLVQEIGLTVEEVNRQFTIEEQEKLMEILKDNLLEKDDIEINKIKGSTSILINELAETNPLFALELNHFYNIDEKTLKIHNSFKALNFENDAPEFSKLMLPEVEKKFTESLDDIIYQTAMKIDNPVYEDVIGIIKNINNTEVDNQEIDELFNDFLLPLIHKMIENDNSMN